MSSRHNLSNPNICAPRERSPWGEKQERELAARRERKAAFRLRQRVVRTRQIEDLIGITAHRAQLERVRQAVEGGIGAPFPGYTPARRSA